MLNAYYESTIVLDARNIVMNKNKSFSSWIYTLVRDKQINDHSHHKVISTTKKIKPEKRIELQDSRAEDF